MPVSASASGSTFPKAETPAPSVNQQINKSLPFVFPGLGPVEPWKPVVVAMTEEQVGIINSGDFTRLRAAAAFVAALAEIGVFEVGNERKTSWALLEVDKAPEATASDYGFFGSADGEDVAAYHQH